MIWVTQWLCPQRHCSIAYAWDDKEHTLEQIELKGETLYQKKIVNRWCGICGQELHIEHGRTAFATMEEAMPSLKETEKENSVARSVIGGNF